MTDVVPERVLCAHRLAKWLGNPDVLLASAALADLTDPAIKSMIAKNMRADAFNEVLDACSELDCPLSAAGMMDLQQRVFAGCRARLAGIFPDDILEEAFGLPAARS